MIGLLDLWLPIVVATVLVFVASSVIHMVLGWHNNDLKPVPDEGRVMDALRAAGVSPGRYMFPHCSDYKDKATPVL
ncbi:MAG: hypothetical protein Kow0020_09230 [Wenzhouxiangellaceae bacterium]